MSNRPSILERLIKPQEGTLSPEHARYILALRFPDSDLNRCESLSYKAQDGTLSKDEEAELDDYLAANAMLMILKSKARVSLRQDNPPVRSR